MSPTGDFNPPLDQVLSGLNPLMSWETAFYGILEPSYYELKDSCLEKILSDTDAVHLLSAPFYAFQPRNAKTKAAFDTATAAINVTPETTGLYDLKELKEDALWLSEECSIGEQYALRIVLLEWQSSPAQRLLTSSSLENAVQSSFLSQGPLSKTVGNDKDEFSSQMSRRLRIIKTYLSERRYILKTSEMLLQKVLTETISSHQRSKAGKSKESWVQKVSNTIINARLSHSPSTPLGQKGFIESSVEALRDRMESLAAGSPCVRNEEFASQIEFLWTKNQLLEMIHILQLLFAALESLPAIPTSNITLSWLRFLRDCSYFTQFDPPHPSLKYLVAPFRSLIGIVSLSMMKLSSVLDMIQGAGPQRVEYGDMGFLPFIRDVDAMSEIHGLLMKAAESQEPTMSMAVFAWSVILQSVREVVLRHREARELEQSLRAVRGFSVNTDADGNDVPDDQPDSTPQLESSVEKSDLEAVLDIVTASQPEEDPIRLLASSATQSGQVFRVMTDLIAEYCGPINSYGDGESSRMVCLLLLDLLTPAVQVVEYSSDVVLATLAILSKGNQSHDQMNLLQSNRVEPATAVLNDPVLMDNVFRSAISRFPYESIPFLRLVRTFTQSLDVGEDDNIKALSILNHMKTFTQVLPTDFRDYEVTDEAKDGNFVLLKAPLPLFIEYRSATYQRLLSSNQQNENAISLRSGFEHSMEIPALTMGRIVSEDKPIIGLWFYNYSGLEYLGKLLGTATSGSRTVDFGTESPVDRQTTIEIIGLITDLMFCSTIASQEDDANTMAYRILEEASQGFRKDYHIVTLIFEIMEAELQGHRPQVDHEGSTDLLTICMNFILALTKALPGRVWPFLSKSALLGIDGLGGKLVSIVTGSEMPIGRYPFLLSCIRVYKSLVNDCALHAIARKSAKKGSGRYELADGIGAGVPEKLMRKVLHAFQRIMMDVFQSCSNWRFESDADRLEVQSVLIEVFTCTLKCVYMVDERSDLERKAAGVLSIGAQHLVEVFLTTNSNNSVATQLMDTLNAGIAMPSTTLYIPTFLLWTRQITSSLELLSSLFNIRTMLKRPISNLENQLFQNSAIFPKLYVSYPRYRLPSLKVLQALVEGATDSPNDETPSLLGFLGIEVATDFLNSLSTLDGVLNDSAVVVGIWNLLSAIVSSNQQWFSVFLLTGNNPRENLRTNEDVQSKNTHAKQQLAKPLLRLALDELPNLQRISKTKAIATINFVRQANDNWAWATRHIQTDLAAFDTMKQALVEISNGLKDKEQRVDSYRSSANIYIASQLIDILAMHCHHSRQIGKQVFGSQELESLSFFLSYAVDVPAYNTSLHSNLKRNFEMKFPGFTLNDFKRTASSERILGPEFFYDVEFASTMLNFEKSWKGFNGREGIAAEVLRANLNFSRVESQIALLYSWKSFVMELSFSPDDKDLQNRFVDIAKACLISNSKANVPTHLFDKLAQTRADLVFFIVQKFTASKIQNDGAKELLKLTWENLRLNEISLDIALSGNNAEYVRSLLRILFLTLQLHRAPPNKSHEKSITSSPGRIASAQTLQIVLDVLTNLVASGFRSLTTSLHDDPKSISPSDLAMLNTLMQSCFRIPGIEIYHPQIVSHFADAQAARIGATLFSWSDRILGDDDLTYAEISTQFLLSMSSIGMIAEHMATDGVLSIILNSRLAQKMMASKNYLDPKNGPLYSTWVRAILPLALNLLVVVGPGIASEISVFVTSFKAHVSNIPTLIAAVTAPTGQGYITLNMASEAHTIALIEAILRRYRNEGPSIGLNPAEIAEIPWDAADLSGAIDACFGNSSTLRSRIVATNYVEADKMTSKSSRSGFDSNLEQMILEELESCLGILEAAEEA